MKILIEVDTTNLENIGEALMLLNKYADSFTSPESKQAVKRTETVVEATKKENEGVDKGEDKKEPEEAPTVTLAELKDLAKKKSDSDGRDVVKGIIGKYADKLANVKAEDYTALAKDLK